MPPGTYRAPQIVSNSTGQIIGSVVFAQPPVSFSAPVKPSRVFRGLKMVLGIPEIIKPVIGAPDGRRRFRFRNTSVAKLYIKTTDGIRCFVLEDKGDVWFCNPSFEQGRNHRPNGH